MTERAHHEPTKATPEQASPAREVASTPLLAVQRKAGNRATMALLRKATAGPEAPAPAPLPPDLAARFGTDLKVQYNSPQLEGVGAHAFAQGTTIHVDTAPGDPLPHEAVHVIQQSAGVQVNDDAGLEREADAQGARAASGAAGPPQR